MVGRPDPPVVVTGRPYLQLGTSLLQQMRLASPRGGIWEAADLQWWARQERSTDRAGQLFWVTHDDPVAAVICTDFGGPRVQCDVLVRTTDSDFERLVWQTAVARIEAARVCAEFPVRFDDAAGIAVLAAAGYECSAAPGVVASWLDAAARPAVPPLPPGYRLLSRADDPARAYWLAARNGPEAERRLRDCSLYRPDLDLMVEAPDGQVAGYGLFWADTVTGVGLVEPMRTEESHQRRGIAGHILASGLQRLSAAGCRRLKVANDIDLYLRSGFVPLDSAAAALYARP